MFSSSVVVNQLALCSSQIHPASVQVEKFTSNYRRKFGELVEWQSTTNRVIQCRTYLNSKATTSGCFCSRLLSIITLALCSKSAIAKHILCRSKDGRRTKLWKKTFSRYTEISVRALFDLMCEILQLCSIKLLQHRWKQPERDDLTRFPVNLSRQLLSIISASPTFGNAQRSRDECSTGSFDFFSVMRHPVFMPCHYPDRSDLNSWIICFWFDAWETFGDCPACG